MSKAARKTVKWIAASAIAGSCWILSPLANQAMAASNQNVQLICDQQSVDDDGEISYHIIYHNVENKNHSNTWLKVKVPEGFECDLEGISGVEWDAQTRILKWKCDDIEGNGARVFHFNLKLKGKFTEGTWFDFDCELEQDGKVVTKTPIVKVRKGTQIDQPFFIGYQDGQFHPENQLTRAEAAAVVTRVKNLSAVANGSATAYRDVLSTHWAADYINEVTKAGYMRGYEDGSFRPDQPISRAELVALALRLRGVHEVPLKGFADSEGHWAKDIIGTAKELKFIDGEGNGRFNPNGATVRDAAAKLFDVALFRGPLVDGRIAVIQHFPDVAQGNWSFGWVEEASVVAHESAHTGRGREYLIRYLPDQTEPF